MCNIQFFHFGQFKYVCFFSSKYENSVHSRIRIEYFFYSTTLLRLLLKFNLIVLFPSMQISCCPIKRYSLMWRPSFWPESHCVVEHTSQTSAAINTQWEFPFRMMDFRTTKITSFCAKRTMHKYSPTSLTETMAADLCVTVGRHEKRNNSIRIFDFENIPLHEHSISAQKFSARMKH